MIVTRDGDTFNVEPLHDAWDFWGAQFSQDWEPDTKAVIERFVDGGTFVDVGAWVGPTTLWASRTARYVIAVEPDPVAYPHLKANVAKNCGNVITFEAAIGVGNEATLRPVGQFGDSQSSLVVGGEGVTVDVLQLSTVCRLASDIQLIKMDIEGGEGIVIPREHEFLKKLGAPLLLSLHPYMWPEDPRPYLDGWSHYEEISQHVGLWIP